MIKYSTLIEIILEKSHISHIIVMYNFRRRVGLGQTGPPPTRNIVDEEPSPDTKLRNHVLLSHAQTMVNLFDPII